MGVGGTGPGPNGRVSFEPVCIDSNLIAGVYVSHVKGYVRLYILPPFWLTFYGFHVGK